MSQSARPPDGHAGQPPLLSTKTLVPREREGLVRRPQLTRRLDDALRGMLTLVSAPAGFGKTTLLSEWLRSRPHSACWLSLDAADNDPPRFLSYVIAALQRVVPGVADDLVPPLRTSEPPSVEAVVTGVVNELASVPDQITLVLDDYHVITSAAVNGALTLIVESLPPNVHLVISTRSDPPIPIARLRSRGQVVEVRADELRFTTDEAAAFLSQTMGLALSSEQVAALEERTEGWIAGLQMAALTMRGRDDVDGFIRAFAGTNRFIMDFMLEEVLARETEEVRAFLLQTAVLSRLSGPLCDAVTDTSGGQEMLERLERRNLFVVPLDDERRWYRYHHLFADLLRARLHQSGPAPVSRLLSRAAEWCELDGQVGEAVGYALAAKDYGRAASLIATHWAFAASTGEIETVWSWLAALPADVVQSSAPLGTAYCWLLWLKGQTGLIADHLADAERALGELTTTEGFSANDEINAPLPAEIEALRAIVARYHGDFEVAVAHAERAIDLMPPDLPSQANAQLRSVFSLVLATACDAAGDLERAVDAYAETIYWSRLGRSATSLAGATYWLIGLLRPLGRLRQADEACREALRFVEEQGMARLPAAGLLHVLMGEMLLERNELEAAESQLSRAAELGRWSGRLDAARNAAPALARLRQARGDVGGALAAIEESESALGEAPPLARAGLLALKARILVRKGSLVEAAACAQEAAHSAGLDRGRIREVAALAASRVLIARGELAEAVAQLTRCLAAAERSGRLGSAIEIRIVRGLALARQGNRREAEADLERALSLAEPEGYLRVFVDEGEPLAELLRRLATRPVWTGGSGAYSAEYLVTLLAAFDAPGGSGPSTISPDPSTTASASGGDRAGREARSGRSESLVEPLSERELEVLRLLAAGLTNEQIARRLTIALGTAKTHVHNVASKLGAQNRVQTVARARELNLL